MALVRPVAAAARLLAACLLAACGHGGDAPAETATPAAARAGASARDKPACPRTGHWSECQVFARLDQSGVAPRRDSVLAGLPNVGVKPAIYTIGKNGLAIYLFPDTMSRSRAARALDTLHFIAPSASLSMRGEATAIQNDNLLGILFSRIDQQRERVSDALMAGAPQPQK
jgi:hypothetical protein